MGRVGSPSWGATFHRGARAPAVVVVHGEGNLRQIVAHALTDVRGSQSCERASVRARNCLRKTHCAESTGCGRFRGGGEDGKATGHYRTYRREYAQPNIG
jgi:hypothetical protein